MAGLQSYEDLDKRNTGMQGIRSSVNNMMTDHISKKRKATAAKHRSNKAAQAHTANNPGVALSAVEPKIRPSAKESMSNSFAPGHHPSCSQV